MLLSHIPALNISATTKLCVLSCNGLFQVLRSCSSLSYTNLISPAPCLSWLCILLQGRQAADNGSASEVPGSRARSSGGTLALTTVQQLFYLRPACTSDDSSAAKLP